MALTYRQLRHIMGYSVMDVAKSGFMNYTTYRQIDNGTSKPENVTMKSFLQICDAYNIHPADGLEMLYDVPPKDPDD